MGRMLLVVSFFAAVTAVAGVAAQTASKRALVEAGKYEQVVEAVAAEGDAAAPQDLYLAAQSLNRLSRHEEAKATFRRLDTAEEPTAWSFIGRSSVAALDGDNAAAVDLAAHAVEMAPDAFHPHYQLGLVKLRTEDYGGAAQAFERATTIDPDDAYAHYYAGVAFNKVRRMDKMVQHFRAFVSLAPEAPEKPQVQAILNTLRK